MSLSILLRCLDIEQTRKFYESVLCFSVAATTEIRSQSLRAVPASFSQARTCGVGPPSFSGTIYITVADVDEYFSIVTSSQSHRAHVYVPFNWSPCFLRADGQAAVLAMNTWGCGFSAGMQLIDQRACRDQPPSEPLHALLSRSLGAEHCFVRLRDQYLRRGPPPRETYPHGEAHVNERARLKLYGRIY